MRISSDHVSSDLEEDVGNQHSFLEREFSRDLPGTHHAFGTYELPNCFGVENFSSEFDYEEMTLDQDAIDTTLVAEKKAKTEISNEMLQGTDGKTDHSAGSVECPSGRCDIKATRNEAGAIKKAPSSETIGGKTYSPQSESTEGRDFATDRQDMHLDRCSLPESCAGDDFSQLDQMTVRKLQDAFRNMFGRETKIRDKQWLKRRILFGIRNSGEANKPLNSLGLIASSNVNEGRRMPISGMGSCELSPYSPKLTPKRDTKVFKKLKESASDSSAKCSSEGSEIGIGHSKEDKDFSAVKGKRAHKPPRRYIEETIKVNPRKISKKSGVSCKRTRDRLVDEKLLHKSREDKINTDAPSALRAGSFDGCIQVPFGLPVEEENTSETASFKPQVADSTPKGHCPIVSNPKQKPDNPPAEVQIIPMRPPAKAQIISKRLPPKLHVFIPQEEPMAGSSMQKGMRRRKHYISWTLSEVMRLIEGVSYLGVGKWSKIKRLLFATSKHRTSVDLKDKWRNLVKAGAHLRRKKKGLQSRKQFSHQAPESVLRRVRELAESHE
ncbi:hypothetical protein MLD38_040166 [Melastoma candidum]|uniref:Uncharacterized protein n=1 Tax=Melastoma candidum TaxID=119954 RepID=A0ACB9L4E3_9MYRT|nr:hypothetical protein MLD38_040166 [Melastoma candidum]